MGIPLPALDIRQQPQPNLLDEYARMQQIQSLIQGRQLSQAELQGRQLENQKSQMQIDAERNVLAAQQDPHWDPTDPDRAIQVLTHYKVPFSVQQNVIAGLKGYRDLAAASSKENLQSLSDYHGFLDDQFSAVKMAPPDQRQSVYEQGLTNVQNYIGQLPNGPGKAQALQELSKIPPMYDATYVNQQHTVLRTQKYLNDEALSQASQYKDTQQGNQAYQAAVNEAGKRDQTSPLFAPTPQAVALGVRQENPTMTDVAAGETQIAGQRAGATAAAEQPYKMQLEQIRQQVSRQMGLNKDAQDKIEGTVLKPYEEKLTSIGQLKSAVTQASQGNVTAARAVALKLIGVTNPEGTKRYNEAEAERMISQGNVPERVKATFKNLLTGDNWTDKMQNDMLSFADAQESVATDNLNRGIDNMNKLYGTNVGQGLKKAGGGGDQVRVQLPGHPPGMIPRSALNQFQQENPAAQVLQ
jgi:hypothetical protein